VGERVRVRAMPMKNPPHPGRIVRRAIIEGLGLTVTSAAEQLGVSRTQLSAILNGNARISPEMAIRLQKGLGSTADHWLRMQGAYDLARQKTEHIRVGKLVAA